MKYGTHRLLTLAIVAATLVPITSAFGQTVVNMTSDADEVILCKSSATETIKIWRCSFNADTWHVEADLGSSLSDDVQVIGQGGDDGLYIIADVGTWYSPQYLCNGVGTGDAVGIGCVYLRHGLQWLRD